MSRLERSEYDLMRNRDLEEADDDQIVSHFTNIVITEIAQMVRSDLSNEKFSYIQIEGSETKSNGKGKKITARNSQNEEIEVVFMPNGEILTHMESKDKARCQQLADDIHQRVLEVCKRVAEREGLTFNLKSTKKNPAFLNPSTKTTMGGTFFSPKAQKFSK